MKILLPFQEDSSLIFAGKVFPKLKMRGFEPELLHIVDRNGKDAVSDRQLSQNIGSAAVQQIDMESFPDFDRLSDYRGVIVSRVIAPMRTMLSTPWYKSRTDRPCFLAFQPGLEFTPSRGFTNRAAFDAIFLNKQRHVHLFEEQHPTKDWRYVTWGHPYFSLPSQWYDKDESRRNIYFFAQAISPKSVRSRQHIVHVLASIARANPDRTVFVKLRHLPSENVNHVHREEFDYPALMEQLAEPLPPNLKTTDCSMSEALEDAAAAITCTSTAAMDSISAGVPTAVYLDYVDFISDPLRDPMRSEFETSGVVTRLHDLLNLRLSLPNDGWLSVRFRDDSLYDEISAVIAAFKDRRELARPA
ncbi:hypothetical protein P6U16_22605 (plasmid) [Rhizobium sp. 32-5/1]|uniref:DUF6716 putative glycosyltransferase n=1 Tax=Rhizobium sp. 32-5/1 TaxID=3019602 RepID=UPI00240E84BB|nr:DUF6716 putative glycosyltransferase [Rhizobium sp. 32-5/1]WEZ85811.1 hypothetical protein P6U16_22605 [Rhizobium sp. 32-5/1]